MRHVFLVIALMCSIVTLLSVGQGEVRFFTLLALVSLGVATVLYKLEEMR